MAGRVALVTGGVGGIGTAIVQTLAKDGHRPVATYAPFEKDIVAAWQKEREAEGLSIPCFEVDVADYNSCKAMAAQVEKEVGPVEILVNNAGITRDGTMKKMTVEQWQAVINVNLGSVFNVTSQFINGMLDRQYGRIVNISSINGQKGQFGQANYAAAKAGMHGFTMSLAQETAKKGITVNSISPGYTATKMVMAIEEGIRNQIIAGIPVGRMGKPEEIGRLVAFLAHEESGFITGANVPINGGQFMH